MNNYKDDPITELFRNAEKRSIGDDFDSRVQRAIAKETIRKITQWVLIAITLVVMISVFSHQIIFYTSVLAEFVFRQFSIIFVVLTS